ncbi:MAG: hypothetical protein PHD31_02755 [Candidatus Pacebacteria bacterium]|nr:hypothetical protein [Candidatus Paceibacterota bacterium]
MELNEALAVAEKEMKEKVKKMKVRAMKKGFLVIAVAIIAFVVSFFIFFKHREVEMTLYQFSYLEMLMPWGYSARYENGIAIIENFFDALTTSILLSLETGVLAGLIIALSD